MYLLMLMRIGLTMTNYVVTNYVVTNYVVTL
jgi:hypothetical protein